MSYRALLIKRELVAAPLTHAVLPSKSWRALRALLNDLTAQIDEYEGMGFVCHAACPIHGHWCEVPREDGHDEHVSPLCHCRWDDYGDIIPVPPGGFQVPNLAPLRRTIVTITLPQWEDST